MLLFADFERMDGGAGKESGFGEGVGGCDILVGGDILVDGGKDLTKIFYGSITGYIKILIGMLSDMQMRIGFFV